MKKTIKFFSMAALAMMGAMAVSCSSDNDELISEQPVNKHNLVTTTVTISFDDATTRTLTDDGTTLSNKFAEGDKIVVFYNEETTYSALRAESEALAAGDISADGKSATFTITLTNPKSASGFRAIYPYNMAKTSISIIDNPSEDEYTVDYSKLATQDGTLATLGTQLNLAMYEGFLTDGKLPSFMLANKLAIAKFKIKDNGGNYVTNTITQLNINDGPNGYQVRPSKQEVIYVAMKPVATSQTISFSAATGLMNYNRSVTGKALTAGHISPINLTMYPMASTATETDKGKLICADGHIHAYDTDAACTADRIALICYVGDAGKADASSDNYKGLALALTDASTSAKWCSLTSATCLDTQYNTEQTTDMAGITNTMSLVFNHDHTHAAASAASNYKYNNEVDAGTHPTGTSEWFLPSAGQWKKMIDACKNVLGTKNSYEDLRDGFSGVGGTNLRSDTYWSSTEKSASRAWRYRFNDSGWAEYYKDDVCSVRACLAF